MTERPDRVWRVPLSSKGVASRNLVCDRPGGNAVDVTDVPLERLTGLSEAGRAAVPLEAGGPIFEPALESFLEEILAFLVGRDVSSSDLLGRPRFFG